MNVFRDHAPGPLSAATRHPAETAGPDDAQVAPEPADLLVIGLGCVGLPLAREAAFAGLTVVGYDLNTEVVAGLNAGRSHVGDVPAGDIAEMLRKGFRATASEEETGDPDTVVICVPTPLSADSGPDQTREVELRRIQGDGVGQVFFGNQPRHQRLLAGRIQ